MERKEPLLSQKLDDEAVMIETMLTLSLKDYLARISG